jgi:hypothetical protein
MIIFMLITPLICSRYFIFIYFYSPRHFNAMGRFFTTRLAEIGAIPVCPYGEGDNDGCMEDDFRAWEKILWPALVAKYIDSQGYTCL